MGKLADMTEGYTGADIAALCSRAVMLTIREHLEKYKDEAEARKNAKELKVTMQHFKEALQDVRPMTGQQLKSYMEATEKFDHARTERIIA